MSGTAPGRAKKAVLGALADDSQTASSPELMSGIMASLLDTGGRPRSWSAQSDRSLPPSTRSHKDSPSRPRVATSFTYNTRPVEARGRITVQPPPAAGPGTPTRGPAALSMMKPLAAAASLESGTAAADGHSSEGPASPARTESSRSNSSRNSSGSSTRAGSNEIHSLQRSGSIGSQLPHDMSSVQDSPRAQLAFDVAVAEKHTAVVVGQSSLWSALSRLSLDSGTRRAAVDQLKDIEAKRSAPHVAPPLVDTVGSRWRGWWPGTSGQGSNTPNTGSNAEGYVPDSPAIAAADVIADSTAAADTSAATSTEAGVCAADDPAAGLAAGPLVEPGADAATTQGAVSTQPEHSQQPRKSMLLPDFDPGSSGFPMHTQPATGAVDGEAADTAAASTDGEADTGAAKGTHELDDA
ncbi:hypothetical protein H4R19_006017, partial [Coemansia spiralis]